MSFNLYISIGVLRAKLGLPGNILHTYFSALPADMAAAVNFVATNAQWTSVPAAGLPAEALQARVMLERAAQDLHRVTEDREALKPFVIYCTLCTHIYKHFGPRVESSAPDARLPPPATITPASPATIDLVGHELSVLEHDPALLGGAFRGALAPAATTGRSDAATRLPHPKVANFEDALMSTRAIERDVLAAAGKADDVAVELRTVLNVVHQQCRILGVMLAFLCRDEHVAARLTPEIVELAAQVAATAPPSPQAYDPIFARSLVDKIAVALSRLRDVTK